MIRAETQTDLIRVNDGANGTNGTNGVSPIATVTQTSTGATISITDSQGTTTANITNGEDGATAEEFEELSEAVANKVERSEVRASIAQNNLLINTVIYDSWFEDLDIYTTSPLPSFTNWSIYRNDAIEEDIFMGTRWQMLINDEEEYIYGMGFYVSYDEEIEGSPHGENEGDIYYSTSCIYQDVILEPNTDYMFSVFAHAEYKPLISCQALNDNYEVIPNTGWDSKDFNWSYIVPDAFNTDYIRVYKSFNSGNRTMWRFRIYDYVTWELDGGDYYDWYSADNESTMNKFQLTKGDTLKEYVDGYWSLSMIKDAINSINTDLHDLTTLRYNTEVKSNRLQAICYGNPTSNNILANTNWTENTALYNGNPQKLSIGSWKIDNTHYTPNTLPNEKWGQGKVNTTIFTNVSGNYNTQQAPDYICWMSPSFMINNQSGTTHTAGETHLLQGGIYQDVEGLSQNKYYTFSLLLNTNIDSSFASGAFVDCKALQYNSSTQTYSVVANTGFDIQEYPYFSGTKTWTVESAGYSSNYLKRVHITFNTGNYTYYRFRIYGAEYYVDANTLKRYGVGINRFSLQYHGSNAPSVSTPTSRLWGYGREYSLSNIYAKSDSIVDVIYPVGSYYETSDTSFNPNSYWLGTTWILETEGMVHVSGSASGTYQVSGANSASGAGAKDGGAATVKLTGPQSGIQAHNTSDSTYKLNTTNRKPGTSTAVAYGTSITRTATDRAVAAKDATSAHENMPPYIVVYRWHRTA